MKTIRQKLSSNMALSALGLILTHASPLKAQPSTADFAIGSTPLQGGSDRFGINLDWAYYNNWSHDPGMEPLAVNLKGTATGGGTDYLINSGPVDTSYNGAFTDGFFVGASIRIYRVINDAVTLIRSATVTDYQADPSSTHRIQLDTPGAPVLPGDIYYLNLVIDNVPVASVAPPIQPMLPIADPWSPIGNVEQFRDRSTVPPVEGGQTSMRLHTDHSEYVGMFQFRYGPEDQWMESLEPGQPYRMEVWLRQYGRVSDEVVLWMDEAYADVATVITGVNESWTQFQYDFIGPARPGPGSVPIPQGLVFEGPGTLWVDNFRVYRTNEPSFVYQSDKITALQEANPATVRLWGGVSNEQLGANIEDWTNPESLSLRQYNPHYGAQYADSNLKLPTALPVVEQLDANPWLVMGPYHSEADWLRLMEYLAGPIGTPFGDKRAAQGHPTPWSDAFGLIYIEYGNESWLPFFEWQTEAVEYGQFAEHFFSVIKSSPYYPQIANKLVFVLNGALDQSTPTDFSHVAIQYCPSAHMVDIAPYIGGWESEVEFGEGTVNDIGFQEYLLFPNSRIKFHTDRHVQTRNTLASQGFDYDLTTYEFGPGYPLPTGEVPVQTVMEAYGKSLAAGVATLDTMLDLQRNQYFSGNFFHFAGGTSYATHTAPDSGFRPHPAWLAVQLANEYATHPRVFSTALNTPTLFVAGEDEFPDAHVPLVDVHAYKSGNDYTVIVLSRSLDTETLVTLHLPFNELTSGAHHMLTGDPRSNNTQADNITIQSEAIYPDVADGRYTFPMPPGSIYVLRCNGTSSTSGLAPQPVLGLAPGQASPTMLNTIEFQASFSQPVMGLTESDITLLGTTPTSSTIVTETSPFDGTQYNIAVNVFNESGTVDVSIPAGAVTNSLGQSSLASVSTHPTVEFFETTYPSFSTPGHLTTLTSSSATFSWSPGDFDVDTYILEIGSQPEWDDVFGDTFDGQTSSIQVNNIPDDGRTLYVRLWYIVGWEWAFIDLQLTTSEAPPLSDPELTSPDNNTVNGTSFTFTWSDNGNAVDRWWLDIGTTTGGGEFHEGNYPGTQTTDTISGLPTDGSSIHVRLWYRMNWNWNYTDYTFQSEP